MVRVETLKGVHVCPRTAVIFTIFLKIKKETYSKNLKALRYCAGAFTVLNAVVEIFAAHLHELDSDRGISL